MAPRRTGSHDELSLVVCESIEPEAATQLHRSGRPLRPPQELAADRRVLLELVDIGIGVGGRADDQSRIRATCVSDAGPKYLPMSALNTSESATG
jgi:hypothetical protein